MKVYIDTSVFGGCFDTEFEFWSIRLFEMIKSGTYRAVISEVTQLEMSFAPDQVKRVLDEIPAQFLDIMSLTSETEFLALQYIKEKALGKKSLADAQHIATATIGQVDLLVSWNFKHIVNFNRIRLFNSVNLKHGYKILEIRNPRDLTDEN